MTGKGILKFLFFFVLLGLIAVTLKQGKEGGELVYKYGANIERVKTLDDELFDAKEELEEMEEAKEAKKSTTPKVEVVKKETVVEKPKQEEAKIVNVPTKDTSKILLDNAKKEMEKASQKALEKVNETVESAVELPATTIE